MLSDLLTKQKLKQLVGNTIYARGEDYFKNGDVIKTWLEDDKLLAKVSGSQGNYQVEIEHQDGGINWQCSCPCDGYICKHIIATGLEFLDKKDEIIQHSKTNLFKALR